MPKWIAEHGLPTAVALAVGVAVVVILQLTRPAPATVEIRPRDPIPTPTVVVYVHVDGAVFAPGVVALPNGARVFEAIDAAGGAAEDAELREMNLAARVVDGQKLVVPSRPGPPSIEADTRPTSPAAGQGTSPPGTARININTASQRMLETLPGIGPVTAGRIIEYRQSNGPFSRIEQLRDARLVNTPTYERIRNLVSVE